MDYESMKLDELKEVAKEKGLTVGNIGKEKLIEKIKDLDAKASVSNLITSEDDDISNEVIEEKIEDKKSEKVSETSLLEAISSAIDELSEVDESEDYTIDTSLSDDDTIGVKSVTFGGLTYISRADNAIFRWNKIGEIQNMSVKRLVEMNNYNSDLLNKPYVILMDDRAIKRFRLSHVYENVAKINNLTAVFKSDMKTIEETIDNALRANMRDVLMSKVRQMIKNKRLNDINVIRLLESKLQFDLSEDI